MTATVDWEQAPREAKWWLMDGTGHAYWYLAPDLIAHTNFWHAFQVDAPTFGYSGNWRDSLTERPPS